MSEGRPGLVLYLVDGLGLSGKTKSLVELACGLDPSRYRAEVCCFDEEDSPLCKRLRAAHIPVHEVRCRDGVNLAIIRRLFGLMKQVRPDLVHCYNQRTMLYGGVAARLLGIRNTVASLSAFASLVPDRKYDFLPQPLFTRCWRNRLRNRWASRLMRFIVTVSRRLGERFCQYNGVPVEKLRVVPYAISLEAPWRYSEEEVVEFRKLTGAMPGDVVVGSVGRLVEQKDYPTQLRAFALALKAAPQLRMVLAGDGPLRQPLEQMAQDLGIAGRVRFLGYCDKVPLLLRSLDVFVMTSRFEPWGIALIEAKAARLPIVATEVNEIPEIISDGQSGLLVPPMSPEPLAAALVKVANEPELRKRLGEQSLREARVRHDLNRTLGLYQDLYDEVRHVGGSPVESRELEGVGREVGG